MVKKKETVHYGLSILKKNERVKDKEIYTYLQHQNLECQYIKSAWEKVSNI